MLVNVAPELLRKGLSVAAVAVRGVSNTRSSPALIAYRKKAAEALASFWKNRSISSHPAIREYGRLHDMVGATNEPASSEKLITFVRRNKDFAQASPVVDCYNIVSARTMLGIGAHDLDKLSLPVTLRYCTAMDTFVALGKTDQQSVNGEYAYVDSHHRVICRLDVLQCDYSKVTADSQNVLFLLQGNHYIPPGLVLKGAWLLTEMIEYFCGGAAEVVAFFDADLADYGHSTRPTISLDTFKGATLQIATILETAIIPGIPALSSVTVKTDRVVKALALSSVANATPIAQQAIVATDLWPLVFGAEHFSAYLPSVVGGKNATFINVKSPIPSGKQLS